MKQYVLCYAESIDDPDTNWIVLIDKISPLWQLGKLNLPGGKIEVGETVYDAAVRELQEETGLVASIADCETLGTLHGIDWIINVVKCPFKGPFNVKYGGTERPVVASLHEALSVGSRVLHELRVIIPLCISRQPFLMILSEDRNYILQVNDV